MNENKLHGIACVVINNRRQVLLLKRSPQEKLFPEKWFVVGAYPLRRDDNFKELAKSEILDEIGVSSVILKEAEPYFGKSNSTEAIVHPFLAQIDTSNIKLNYEHTEFRWVTKSEIKDFDLVPGIEKIITNFLND